MLLASFLIVFMIFGCGGPAGTAASSVSPCSTSQAGPRASSGGGGSIEPSSGAPYAEPGWASSAEPTGGSAGEPELETQGSQELPAGTVSGSSVDSAFGGARDLDDPFALIGPAFSGMGFQSYSSGCDPFEDKYGTCL